MSDQPSTAHPVAITVHQQSKLLEIGFDDGQTFAIPFELLRVYSPSAEVQGHGPGQETLQTGKREVGLLDLEPVGNYAVKPVFDDGHASGLYTWSYLHDLGLRQQQHWAAYLARLKLAGVERDTPMATAGSAVGSGHGCGSGGACGCH